MMTNYEFDILIEAVNSMNEIGQAMVCLNTEIRKRDGSPEQIESGLYYLHRGLENAGKNINILVGRQVQVYKKRQSKRLSKR